MNDITKKDRLELLENIAKYVDKYDEARKYDSELADRMYFVLQQNLIELHKLEGK